MPMGIPKGKTKLTDEERKAKRNEYSKRPEVKAKRNEYSKRPEVKAKRRKYLSRPEVNAKVIENRNRPEVKAKAKKYHSRPEVKAKAKARSQTPEVKAKAKTYREKSENRSRQKERYQSSEHKAKKNNARKDIRLNILQVYSKRLSNSDIPCCNCCGLNSHLDFLALDHIAGKRQMDSEPELVKLGYSSKLKSVELQPWIRKNNFPDGFQILCHNCNQAKSSYGKCPHEMK
jgi:hypothetical protein